VEQAIAVRSRVVFDLAQTTFIDSSGLAVILRTHRALGQIREAVVLRSASRRVRMLFELTGCDGLVTFD
jgi:anti-anti-sigma factor